MIVNSKIKTMQTTNDADTTLSSLLKPRYWKLITDIMPDKQAGNSAFVIENIGGLVISWVRRDKNPDSLDSILLPFLDIIH